MRKCGNTIQFQGRIKTSWISLYIFYDYLYKNNLIHTYPLTKRGRLSTCHRSLKKMSKLHQQIFQLFFSNPQCSKKSAKKCNLKKSLHSKKFQTTLILVFEVIVNVQPPIFTFVFFTNYFSTFRSLCNQLFLVIFDLKNYLIEVF